MPHREALGKPAIACRRVFAQERRDKDFSAIPFPKLCKCTGVLRQPDRRQRADGEFLRSRLVMRTRHRIVSGRPPTFSIHQRVQPVGKGRFAQVPATLQSRHCVRVDTILLLAARFSSHAT